MDAFIDGFRDAMKYHDKERGEKRIKVYVNDELEGTYSTAIVLGIPADDGAINEDGFEDGFEMEMEVFTFRTFNIAVYLAAQHLFNEVINREIEQCIMDASNNLAKKYGKNPELLEREFLGIVRDMQKQIISKADISKVDEPSI